MKRRETDSLVAKLLTRLFGYSWVAPGPVERQVVPPHCPPQPPEGE